MKKNILLIDDDQFMRDLVALKLSSDSFSPAVAATAEEGFAQIKIRVPDVILLDLNLPDMSGLEVLAELKKTKETAKVPVIIFSNDDSAGVQESAKKIGADDFFVKIAVNPDALIEKINSVLA